MKTLYFVVGMIFISTEICEACNNLILEAQSINNRILMSMPLFPTNSQENPNHTDGLSLNISIVPTASQETMTYQELLSYLGINTQPSSNSEQNDAMVIYSDNSNELDNMVSDVMVPDNTASNNIVSDNDSFYSAASLENFLFSSDDIENVCPPPNSPNITEHNSRFSEANNLEFLNASVTSLQSLQDIEEMFSVKSDNETPDPISLRIVENNRTNASEFIR